MHWLLQPAPGDVSAVATHCWARRSKEKPRNLWSHPGLGVSPWVVRTEPLDLHKIQPKAAACWTSVLGPRSLRARAVWLTAPESPSRCDWKLGIQNQGTGWPCHHQHLQGRTVPVLPVSGVAGGPHAPWVVYASLQPPWPSPQGLLAFCLLCLCDLT